MDMDLLIERWDSQGAMVIVPHGVLGPAGFGAIREAVLAIASDEPRAVIVDIDRLTDDHGTSLTSFAALSAEMDVWPGVPLLIVASGDARRRALARRMSTRTVPVCHSAEAAIGAIVAPPPRKIARLLLPNGAASVPLARQFVHDCCRQWDVATDQAADVTWIANEFVEYTLGRTCGPPTIRLERLADLVTVSVFDDNPGLYEPPPTIAGEPADNTRGLSIVGEMCHAGGLVRTAAGGKVVWAAV